MFDSTTLMDAFAWVLRPLWEVSAAHTIFWPPHYRVTPSLRKCMDAATDLVAVPGLSPPPPEPFPTSILTAEEFVRAVREGFPHSWEGCEVRGEVALRR